MSKKAPLQIFSDLTSQLNCKLIGTLTDNNIKRTNHNKFVLYYPSGSIRLFMSDWKFLKYFSYKNEPIFTVNWEHIKGDTNIFSKILIVELNNF